MRDGETPTAADRDNGVGSGVGSGGPVWSWLAAVAGRISALDGWHRAVAATAAGAISIIAMAPFFLWPVLFATLPMLVWLIEGARREVAADAGWKHRVRALRDPALVGWCFGFGFHAVGLYWLREAFAVTAGNLELLWPLAVLGLPAYLGVFHATAAAVAAAVPGSTLRRTFALALALMATEWLRGHLFTGFPWNVLGYALTYPLVLLQSVSVVGIYGLTLIAVPILAGPAVLLASTRQTGKLPAWRAWVAAVLLALLPLGAMAAYGAWRLAAPQPAFIEGVRLRLVQPSVPQRAKWQAERQLEFFNRHVEMSGLAPNGQPDHLAGITHVLWPEAAMPFQPLRYPSILAAIGEALPDGVQLLAGLLRTQAEAVGVDRMIAYNSVGAFDHAGQPVAIYDKVHLVPFGEYLPFQATLESVGLSALTRQRGGFGAGATPRPLLRVPGLPPLGVLICYEAVFPAAVVQGRERPGLLVNLTNDGWFGNSTGPRQHLQQARTRAVEEGIPLVRVANNGISAMFDAHGRELVRIELDVAGVADTGLPGVLPPPLYARIGDWAAVALWVAMLGGLLLGTRQRRM